MEKKSAYLIAVLALLTSCIMHYQILVYQGAMLKMMWANETLYLNVIVNRQEWSVCKRFGRCDESHPVSRWKVNMKGAMAFQG
jgi:hypothetical protein